VVGAGDGSDAGNLTVVGTVSSAGGKFEEPVTQSNLGTVKTFLGLSYDRAYKRFYPAIDPLISWSRHLDQLRESLDRDIAAGWADPVARIQSLFEKGDEIYRMMQVTGEEGVSLDDYVLYQKALLVDMVYLQQDAFDEVDVSTPLERQKLSFELVRRFTDRSYRFDDKKQARGYFTRVTNAFKNLNYSETDSDAFRS
jgi:V/A-type H+-transporting ATPase subunit A